MPNRLTENRDLLESLFVFGLWKDPKGFRSFRNKIASGEFFSSVPAQFYYNLGLNMFEKGYDEFDKVSVATTVNAIPGLATEYNKLGGFETYEDVKRGVKSENLEGLYNDITKLNCLTTLHEKGFDVLGNWAKMQKMNTDQIRRYFSFQLNDTFLNQSNANSKIEDFTITDEDDHFFQSGSAMGFSIAEVAPLLNYELLGISNGLTFIGAASNVGKTAFMIRVLFYSWLKAGYKVALASNEQGLREFKQLVLAMVSHELNNKEFLTRRRIKMGNYTSKEGALYQAAKEYINEHLAKKVMFLKIFDYSMDSVEQFFEIASARGFKAGIYDVFKADDMESGAARGQMIEASKVLFNCADRNQMSIVASIQLALYMENTRYLRLSNIGHSKQVVEPATEVILIRELWDCECSGEKYDIKCYNFEYNPKTGQKIIGMDGKPVKKFIEIPVGTHEDYRLAFISKTRNAKKGVVIVFRYDGDANDWVELGYATKISTQDRGGNRK